MNLLFKEIKLALHPSMFIYLALSTMVLIPAYPYHLIFFYTALGIFNVSMFGRENSDPLYSVILPVAKRDVVRARIQLAALCQLAQILVCVLLMPLARRINPTGNAIGLDANLTFLGSGFLLYTVFNFIFFPAFYKTAYKVGVPFILGCVGIAVYMLAEEGVLLLFPPAAVLDGFAPEHLPARLLALGIGFAVWLLGLVLTYKRAAARFEKVDL